MKIIATSNYADEVFSEYVAVDTSINLHQKMVEAIVETMNNNKYRGDSIYYVAKPDDYVCYRFQP